MDRFMLAENVNRKLNKQGERPVYILQTIQHKMLIEVVFSLDGDFKYELDDVFNFFQYRNPDGVNERYMLIVRDFYDLEIAEIDDNIEKIKTHINRAWRWYRSYLESEDATLKHSEN